MSLSDRLHEDLTPEQRTHLQPTPKRGRRKGGNGRSRSDPAWAAANTVETERVLDALGIAHDGRRIIVCPGCGAEIGCDIVDGGIKCFHASCAGRGRAGFRTNVDLVAEVKGVEPHEAVNWIAERFGFEGLKSRPKHTSTDLGEPAELPPEAFDDDVAGLTPNEPEPTALPTRPRFIRLGVDGIFAPLPPVPWLLRDLDIAPGAPTLVAGYGFAGKSLAAQAMASAVASDDGEAWGLFAVRHGRVLHIDYEQGKRLTCERYQRIARGLGLAPQDLANRLAVVSLPPHYLDVPGAEDLLVRELDGHALCIIDPFRGAAPSADENCSRDVRRVLDTFTRASERTGCVLLDIHHARKPTKDASGGARMNIRGTGDFYAAHGSVLIFDAPKDGPIHVRHDKARITGRCHDDFELRIEDTDDGGVRVTAGLCLASTVDPIRQLKDGILAVVRGEPGLSRNAICIRVKGTKATKLQAMREMVDSGELNERGGGLHATP